MNSETQLPSFGETIWKEDSILYDNYCYSDPLSFDLYFSTQKLDFSMDGSLKNFSSSCSFEFNHNNFYSYLSFNTKKPSNFRIYFPKNKLMLHEYITKNLSTKTSLRLNPQIKIASVKSKLKPNLTASTAIISETLKSKLKLSSKKLAGNFTFGTGKIGFGLRGGMNWQDFSANNYSIVAWYCKESCGIKAMYDGNWEWPEENRLNGYFYFKAFGSVQVVAKLNSDLKKKHRMLIGCEGELWEKGRWKIRGSSKGKLALGASNKVMPGSRVKVAALVNVFNIERSKLGMYFRVRAKGFNE